MSKVEETTKIYEDLIAQNKVIFRLTHNQVETTPHRKRSTSFVQKKLMEGSNFEENEEKFIHFSTNSPETLKKIKNSRMSIDTSSPLASAKDSLVADNDVFEPLYIHGANDVEEDEWLPVAQFVDSFKHKRKEPSNETSRTIINIQIIQSALRGYKVRNGMVLPNNSDPIDYIISPKAVQRETPFEQVPIVKESPVVEPKVLASTPSWKKPSRAADLKKFRDGQAKKWEVLPVFEIPERRRIYPGEDEDWMNPLFEEDVVFENPLYDEDFCFENPLYEEEIVYFNELFEESNSTMFDLEEKDLVKEAEMEKENQEKNEKNEELRFIETLRMKLPIQDIFQDVRTQKRCFRGKDFVDFLTTINQRLSRPDARYIGQTLMDQFVFKNLKISNRTFEDDENQLYRFVEDYHHPSVLNGPPPDFDFSFQPKLDEDRVLRKINNLWKSICSEFVKVSPKNTVKIGYKLLAVSPAWIDLKSELFRLQKFDPLKLGINERKAFFINIYNIMIIHALMLCGRPSYVISRTMFFKTKYYVIGNYKLSLDDIEHSILRGDMSIPHQLYVQCFGGKNSNDLSCFLDPRIHFALHRATESSPVLRYYDHTDLDEELDLSVRIYLQNQIVFDKNVIHLPKVFYVFGDDFGIIRKRLDFIHDSLSETQREKFQEIRRSPQFVVKFLPYNWSLNQKDKNEEVADMKIEFREVLADLQYREYFRKFSTKEFNEENLACFEEIERFHVLPDGPKRFGQAKTIYDTFLHPGAPKEININQKPVQLIYEQIKNEEMLAKNNSSYVPTFHNDAFEEVYKNIRDCMIDIFARFQAAPDYQEMILVQLENRLKSVQKGSLDDELIGASMMGIKLGQYSRDLSQKKVSPYYSGLFEKYDKWKDSMVIQSSSGFEEIVPLNDMRRSTIQIQQEKRKTIVSMEPIRLDEPGREEVSNKEMEKIINDRSNTLAPTSRKSNLFTEDVFGQNVKDSPKHQSLVNRHSITQDPRGDEFYDRKAE